MLTHPEEKRQQGDLPESAARLDKGSQGRQGVTPQVRARAPCTSSLPKECLRRGLGGGILWEAVSGHLL